MTDPQFASTLFDSLVDAGTSPQEIIDGGFGGTDNQHSETGQ